MWPQQSGAIWYPSLFLLLLLLLTNYSWLIDLIFYYYFSWGLRRRLNKSDRRSWGGSGRATDLCFRSEKCESYGDLVSVMSIQPLTVFLFCFLVGLEIGGSFIFMKKLCNFLFFFNFDLLIFFFIWHVGGWYRCLVRCIPHLNLLLWLWVFLCWSMGMLIL